MKFDRTGFRRNLVFEGLWRGRRDLAPDGTVYGLGLLNAKVQLRAADNGQLVIDDEAAGRQIEVPLPNVA